MPTQARLGVQANQNFPVSPEWAPMIEAHAQRLLTESQRPYETPKRSIYLNFMGFTPGWEEGLLEAVSTAN